MTRAIFFLLLFTCRDLCIAQVTPTLVSDLTPGAAGTSFLRSTVFNGKFVFTTDCISSTSRASQLWISDGTTYGTFSLGTFDYSWSPFGFVELNDKLFFVAADNVFGNELRCTDGTVAGTNVVKDIQPGRINGLGGLPVKLFNKLYFVAHGGYHCGEIWVSDGSAGGTHLFAHVDPPSGTGCNISNPVVANDKLYFTVSFGPGHLELWESDTTASSAKMLFQLDGDEIHQVIVANRKLYYIVSTDNSVPFKDSYFSFCVSDGTQAGTFPLISGMLKIPDYVEMGGKLYFYGWGVYGAGIWVTDGTVAGTTLIKDSISSFWCDTYQPGSTYLTVFKNKLYFGCAGIASYNNELWVSDGTPSGTHAMMSFSAPGTGGSGTYPRQLTATENYLFFKAWDDSTKTVNLWRSNGTVGGAQRKLTEQICAPLSSAVDLVDSTIFYVAEYDGAHIGDELYRITAFLPAVPDAPDSAGSPQDSVNNVLDSVYAFFKCYPNPTSGDLFINVVFDQPTIYTVGITSLDGKTEKQLEKIRYVDAGIHTLQYSLSDLPAGIYIGRFTTDKFTIITKVIVLH